MVRVAPSNVTLSPTGFSCGLPSRSAETIFQVPLRASPPFLPASLSPSAPTRSATTITASSFFIVNLHKRVRILSADTADCGYSRHIYSVPRTKKTEAIRPVGVAIFPRQIRLDSPICTEEQIMNRVASIVSLVIGLCLNQPALGADQVAPPLVVELWPGKVPDETGSIGAEK